jgi:hypothetical protein
VCDLVSLLKGITKDEDVQEKGRCFGASEENNRKLEEMRSGELHEFYFQTKHYLVDQLQNIG